MIKGSIQKEDITIIDINIYAPKVALVVKNPPASAEDARDAGWSLGQEDPLEKATATHSSILAWKITKTEEPGRLQSIGLLRVRCNWAQPIVAHQYIRQMLTTIKGEIHNNTITVGDFKIPLTTMGRSSGQKVNKETQALNHTHIRQDGPNWYLWDIPSQNSRIYFFFKCVWNILQDRSHLGSQIKSP